MSAAYRFGPYALSTAQRALTRDGQPVALGGRAFDLLVALIERAGRTVAKDELLDAVWGRTIVEEGNLHVQVSALRKVLGAAAVVTVPGQGYRFEPPGPLRTAEPAPSRAAMPAPAGPVLFGRESDLGAVQALLQQHRLVTIVGPGGIGKTRLARRALELASSRHADGAGFVDLAALADSAYIADAIAAALQLPLARTRDPLEALRAAVRPMRALVLLDNAEHLVDGVAAVAQALLADGPGLVLMVTSQLPLKIDGEQVLRLDGLAVPDAAASVDEALRCGAVALFDERLRAVDRHFRITEANVAAVIEICLRLDGIALAIELAAARCPLLGLQGVARRLGERLQLLRSGHRTAPSRQQTLHAAMAWSHGLLSDDQARAFRRLSVCAGGFDLALAQALLQWPGLDDWAGIELLAELVDRSLVALVRTDGAADAAPRYRLLETARAYAAERLAAAGETADAQRTHARALRAIFDAAWEDAWQLPEAAFLARHEPGLDNLRAALDWAQREDPETAIALAGSSSRLWRGLSLHPEALRRLMRAAEAIDADTPPALAARLWEGLAQLQGEIASTDSRASALRALALYRALGDRCGEYLALAHQAFSYRAATPEAHEASARMQQLEDPAWPPALRLYGVKVRGGLASDAGRVDEARAAHEARLALATQAGVERDVHAALGNLADLALMTGDADEAARLGRALLARLGTRQAATRAIALGNLLLAVLAQGRAAEARAVLAEFADVSRQLGHLYVMYTADAMAWLATLEGRSDAAQRLVAYADAAYEAESQPREPNEARARAAALAGAARAGSVLEEEARAAAAAMTAEQACALALGKGAAGRG